MGYSLILPEDCTLYLQTHDRFASLVESGRIKGAEIIAGLWGAVPPSIQLTKAGLSAMGIDALKPDSDVLQGTRLKIGGYGEIRSVYEAEAFQGDGAEPRQLHLGLDLFAKAGTAISAPLAGRIHSFQDNDAHLDYGPTLILQHQVDDLEFYSLYGHMSRQSLNSFAVGKAFSAGDILGHIGDVCENGGWAPHLHFQIILDIMGFSGDFPGVFRQSEGAFWRLNCPDPRPLLGVSGQD